MANDLELRRRELLQGAAAATAAVAAPLPLAGARAAAAEDDAPHLVDLVLRVNGRDRPLRLDTRTTLLDALRDHLDLTGSKKGCDHGQCGACTVLVGGRRINACLSLAVMHEGDEVTTIEGLASGDGGLHPMQAAFVAHDGFQCGYCTPGQVCSAVAMLEEVRAGMPSAATPDLASPDPPELTDDEIRERMSGNLCRCGAYPNIVAAIREVAASRTALE